MTRHRFSDRRRLEAWKVRRLRRLRSSFQDKDLRRPTHEGVGCDGCDGSPQAPQAPQAPHLSQVRQVIGCFLYGGNG